MATPTLHSYIEGQWRIGTGELRELLDAATGETVALIPAAAADPGAALQYARAVGGPALRELTFTERAAILKALARNLSEHVDEFAALSTRTGATRRDTTVDVEGGIGTVAVYASKGARGLPDTTVLADGDTEPLGRAGTFAGRHMLTAKLGAAVQINAFNFPVWGMLEKFAPAFLAGMPSVVKPASQTAYLTELVVRRIIESGLLPDGALSLLCGGPSTLLDELSSQDTLGFTGSAAVAKALRVNSTIVSRSVAFNAEADSLNCSILGPDVIPDDPEFALYVDQLVTEMTVKAGQKCTAIRRAFVPASLAAAVVDAVSDRLAGVRVGHPGDTETDMGPVAGLAQRVEVRTAVQRLTAEATLVFGDPRTVPDSVAPSGGSIARGAFVSPMLLRCDDLGSTGPHDVEAFGPVATVLPYRDVVELLPAVARGDGSLVGSIVTHDRTFALALLTELAPWHGRLLVLDRDNAAESTGHGVAMPQLQHGGPGRAGGGAELGGLRALHHYLQRTAVQGSPALLAELDKVGGRG